MATSIPALYWIWLSGATFASLGTQILAFSMVWVAAGYGGAFAGLVLTATNLPRALLLLVGGTVVDRYGAWKVMLCGDAAMTMVTGAFAGVLLICGPSPWLLVAVALLIGVVDSCYMPAAGSMPRRLVPQDKLGRAMAARQISSQLASVIGGPIGAVVVAAFGITAAAIADSVTFAAMFVLLLIIRPRRAAPNTVTESENGVSQRFFHEAVDGLRLSLREPLLRLSLFMLIGCAAFLLPVLSLVLPVLARQAGWEPTQVGLVYGVSALGTAIVAVGVLITGGFSRPGLAGCGGLALAATGVLGLALVHDLPLILASGVVVGMGTGLFSTHIGPLVLGRTPETHIGRIQSIVAMAQVVPLLATNLMLGSLAQFAGAKASLVLCSVVLLVIAAVALSSMQLRKSLRP